MAVLWNLLTGIWGKIVGIGVLILAVLAGLAKIKRDGIKQGRAEEQAKARKALDKAIEDRRLSDEVVNSLSDDAVRDRLRDKWSVD